MPLFLYEDSHFKRLEPTNFETEGILERPNLQVALRDQIDIICPDCLVIAEEFSEWVDSRRRIDLLAVDKDANLVVVELKRTATGEYMDLQAIRYAAMVSTLTFKRAVEILGDHLQRSGSDDSPEQRLLDFLGWDEPQEGFASAVRITLVSADFSKELTTAVMWLNDQHIDIRCVRLTPYRHGEETLVDVQQIIPLMEAESYQVGIRQQSDERREARQSQRDLTRYRFKGTTYNKRKLVLAVVKEWVAANKPETSSELFEAFPQETHRAGLFVPFEQANDIYGRQHIARHFIGEGEVFEFPGGDTYALSNQWGIDNLENFIECARSLGCEIEESSKLVGGS